MSDLALARNCCLARMLPGEAELVSEPENRHFDNNDTGYIGKDTEILVVQILLKKDVPCTT